ncbi:MAG: hypothetical protein EOS23_26350 [Mesorhizobium sp.]|uniref:hypothetical protein n=1 Tax=Mesorhizobium sp. TaxID=1871066 RepID=UPI000FE84C86|nr:hypothetical protein [Mesorhizobium sp.]RWE07648.1 MAG: hypothetical protein EOS23_26350 [Mesorhizobium sp.]RWP55870.1 MAG: hypothetical protein EOR07_33000 [Mesorhizobium sp.]
MKIKALNACALAVAVFAGCNSSFAASTDWLPDKQMKNVIRSWGGGLNGPPPKFYPTAVNCKDDGEGPQFKMTYTPMSDPKPFHRWNWLNAKTSDLTKAVGRLKLSDEKHLKYRVIQKSDYVTPSGTKMSCAIVYR